MTALLSLMLLLADRGTFQGNPPVIGTRSQRHGTTPDIFPISALMETTAGIAKALAANFEVTS